MPTAGDGLPECPAAPPPPGLFVHREVISECLASVSGQEGPGDREVAGWITNSTGSEVDDGCQLSSVVQEKVPGGDVAVEPTVDAVPWR